MTGTHHRVVPSPAPVRRQAALYLRMSTDMQAYSLANQAEVLVRYALDHAMDVIRTYADEGKSGLTFDGRRGLQQLMADVQDQPCPFSVLLTYDVSRWGRFQEADEGAYYEHLCRRSGVEVIYCAEAFSNDGTPMSAILKSLKRIMAAEYSRELSAKIIGAHHRLAALGYHQGGPVCFGLRRHVVSVDGTVHGVLKKGQMKPHHSDHIVILPGPAREVALIQRIFHAFVVLGQPEEAIVAHLNSKKSTWADGKPWTLFRVTRVLTQELYIGNRVYACTTKSLQQKTRTIAPEHRIRHDHAFAPMVPVEHFTGAAAIFRARRTFPDDAALVGLLQALHQRHGMISRTLIDGTPSMPSSSAYVWRFGGLLKAYQVAGLSAQRNHLFRPANRPLAFKTAAVLQTLMSAFGRDGSTVTCRGDILTVDQTWRISVKLVRSRPNLAGNPRWYFRPPRSDRSDFCLLVRLDDAGDTVIDFYVLPMVSLRGIVVRLGQVNNRATDQYRVDHIADIKPLALACIAFDDELTDRVGRTDHGPDKRLGPS
jgi:DNA invertase Pin-like site-specific DNA recombinase